MALENGFTTRENFIDMSIVDTPPVVSSDYRYRKRNILLGISLSFGIVLVGILITIFFVYKVILYIQLNWSVFCLKTLANFGKTTN